MDRVNRLVDATIEAFRLSRYRVAIKKVFIALLKEVDECIDRRLQEHLVKTYLLRAAIFYEGRGFDSFKGVFPSIAAAKEGLTKYQSQIDEYGDPYFERLDWAEIVLIEPNKATLVQVGEWKGGKDHDAIMSHMQWEWSDANEVRENE